MGFDFVNEDQRVADFKPETVNSNGVRYYKVDEVLYPSITSVLSRNPEKVKSLQEWRKRVGDKEASKISQKAASRGTKVHQICEDYINNREEYTNGAMPDAIEMFKALKPVLDKSLNNIHVQEAALYSKHLGVAGRVDCIAEWDGVLSVVDFKTSMRPKKVEWISDYFMQCSAYAAMYYEMTDTPIKDVVVAIMVEGEPDPQIFKGKVGEWLPDLKKAVDRFNDQDS